MLRCRTWCTCCPEGLGHTSRHGSVGWTEQLHDHAVAHALQTLYHNTVDKPQAHEDRQSLDKVETDANETLAVETEQHDPLPAISVGETPKDDSTQHHATEVDCGHQRGNIALVTDQLPLQM